MKVLMTTQLIKPTEQHLACFADLDVDFVQQSFTSEDALIAEAQDADAILVLVEDFNSHVIGSLQNCKVISRFGIGVDNIDVSAASARGIVVCNVPDANYHEVATHTIALALSLTRKLGIFDSRVRRGDWGSAAIGMTLRRPQSQVFGLIGFGRIGQRVAAIAAAIGFEVWVSDPQVPDETLTQAGVKPVSLEALLAGADIVSLHVPLTDTTKMILDERAMLRMKPTAVLINVSRGGLVDEAALYRALCENRLAGAGLDTFSVEPLPANYPLARVDNVILTPHAAHFSTEAMDEGISRTLQNAARVLRGQEPHHRVN